MHFLIIHTFCHVLLAEVVALQFWRIFAPLGVHCKSQKQEKSQLPYTHMHGLQKY